MNIPSVNPNAPAGRIIPDVAADAALNTGYRMYGPNPQSANPPSTWQTVGGTSAATPLWAALLARIQQLGKKVGFFTPRLYASTPSTSGKPLGAVACRDIRRDRMHRKRRRLLRRRRAMTPLPVGKSERGNFIEVPVIPCVGGGCF